MNIGEFFLEICKGIYNCFAWIMSFLPDSPLKDINIPDDVTNTLSFIGFFVPVKALVSVISAWLSCIIIYFIYSLIMKFFKVIGSAT